MAHWSCYQAKEGESKYMVTITVYVKALTEKEAEQFVLDKIQVEGGFGIYVEELTD